MNVASKDFLRRTEKRKNQINKIQFFQNCLLAVPTEERINSYFASSQINNIISFIDKLYEEKNINSDEQLCCEKIMIGPDDILDKLKIISKNRFLRMSNQEFQDLIYSENMVDLLNKIKNMQCLLSYEKIDVALCKKIPNLILVGAKYSITGNSYVDFYYYGQPNQQLMVRLNYAYILFSGDESPEKIEEINNYWLVFDEQNPDEKLKKQTWAAKKYLNLITPKFGTEDVYAAVEQVFLNENMRSNFLRCNFIENNHEAVSSYLWDYSNPDKIHGCSPARIMCLKNSLYSMENISCDIELEYTPVIYEICISFYKTFEQLNKSKFSEKKFQRFEHLSEILETLRVNPPNYNNSFCIKYCYCKKCKFLERCETCDRCYFGDSQCVNSRCKCHRRNPSGLPNEEFSDDEQSLIL